MELESPSGSSEQLIRTPPLERPFRMPLHAQLPLAAWRREAREAAMRALEPVFHQHPHVRGVVSNTDWPLVCLLHPTAVPRGPMRATFAMPQSVSAHGSSWLSLLWLACKLENRTVGGESSESLLAAWMNQSSLDKLVVFDPEVFRPDGVVPTPPPPPPPVVTIPGAICLVGMVWREGGNSAAATLIESMLEVNSHTR